MQHNGRETQQIDIHYYAPSNGEKKVIPVLYDVEDHQEQCMQIIRCKVNLPKDESPSWLYPSRFDLITRMHNDLQVADYRQMHSAELRTLDAEFFRYKVYSEIVFREQRLNAEKYEGVC